MANHKSALKRIRANKMKQMRNRYHAKTMRNAIKKFRLLTDVEAAKEQYPKLVSLIDKNAKRRIIHKNKAANLKSKLSRKLVVAAE
ncbi:MAG TPA: 30S ribosomal protein S20 [Bacteroidales bacterium]|nr:30S ribosomal protein S20 [Bacteroidales bacterium]HPR57324.1 30S ribosomal protein S20 [Bacteroidales bacterium]HRW97152.1 30S ribosomal protein S20 [Bacteroidales bacterium]